MKRRIAFMVVILSAMCLTACGGVQGAVSEQGDEKAYSIDFTALNTAKAHELLLEKNDTLQVEITHNRGNIKLAIQGKDGHEAYAGNRLLSSVFTVGIPESGKYTVTVAGENSDGSVRIFVISENQAVKNGVML